MLLGEFRHSLDSKGRVFLPARWREELGDQVVITKGLDKSLSVMTSEEFARKSEELKALRFENRGNRSYMRVLFSGASEEAVDRQGRVTVPPPLREYAGLGKEVTLVGVGDRAEIWHRETWETYRGGVQDSYEQIAEELEL